MTPATGYHVDSILVDGGIFRAVNPLHSYECDCKSYGAGRVAIDRFPIAATAGANGSLLLPARFSLTMGELLYSRSRRTSVTISTA
jgi:hypothetical protein